MGDFIEQYIKIILAMARIIFPPELLAVIFIITLFFIWRLKRGNNKGNKISGNSKPDS